MIERFQGENNKHNLRDALLNQFVVNNDGSVADAFFNHLKLQEFKPGETILLQNSSSNHICFIFSGLVAIEINDREVARRGAGHHVGEMALIDVSAKRSATVRAIDETVIGSVNEADFSDVATNFPFIWRRLALALGQRLRERSGMVRSRNETPRIFIGSSAEGLDIARAIQTGFAHDPLLAQVWTDDVFKASKTSIENLVSISEIADFGVLVLGPDDEIKSRDQIFEGPRDNVIFELGLFIGSVGRDRTFFVKQQGSKIKIPSDLLGTTPIEYKPGKPEDLGVRIATACSEIRLAVKKLGAR